ncbi:hypothetical protein NHQ30_003610 [Ciborinia camelliae]|nr:hypothetical protein NHQ30_003610 [Ciborinia camelliae]
MNPYRHQYFNLKLRPQGMTAWEEENWKDKEGVTRKGYYVPDCEVFCRMPNQDGSLCIDTSPETHADNIFSTQLAQVEQAKKQEARKAGSRAYYNRYKEKKKAKSKAYYNKNKEKEKAKSKAYYNKNKAKKATRDHDTSATTSTPASISVPEGMKDMPEEEGLAVARGD